jgi:predicted NAD/FAD-dependent oxidoreductase
MSGLPRAMADGLNVRLGAQVTAVRAKLEGWQLDIDAACIETRRLVVTVPAPQAAALLGDGHPLHDRIAGVAMAPCLTLMAAFPADAPRPFRSRAADDHPLAWSEQHLEDTSEIIAGRMLPMLAEVIGVAPQSALYAAAHRWRYARTVAPLGEPFLRNDDGTLHVGGDWCVGARVEAAWASGTAIADAMIAQKRSL